MELKNLPNEIQEVIYGYLDNCDLLNMILVDNHTKNIIENSPSLMKKIPLLINDEEFCCYENERSIKPLLDSNRRVSKIIVKLKHSKIMNFLAIFKKFSDTIRFLEINDYNFETIDQLRLVLRYLNNLQSLTVINVLFIKSENKLLNSIVRVPNLSLTKLREISCVNSDIRLFTLFSCNYDIQLRKIRVKLDSRIASNNCRDFCKTMIHQVAFLQSLTLDSIKSDSSNIFNYGNFVQCQLERFEIINCQLSRDHMRNLIEMIKFQKRLKVLKFIKTPIPSSLDVINVYRDIFSNNIKEVHIDINNLLTFHSHSFSNGSVTNLIINGNFRFENLPVFINMIKIFPNVERLKLIGDMPINDKYLFHILATFGNLQELSLPGFTCRTIDSNFSNLSCLNTKLKVLILEYIDFDVKYFGWKNIVTYVNRIEKLVIKRDYCNVSNEIVDIIVRKLNLKHLELGYGVVSEDILRNIVYNNYCKDLRLLKISQTDFRKINFKFDFYRLFKSNRLLLSICPDEYFMS